MCINAERKKKYCAQAQPCYNNNNNNQEFAVSVLIVDDVETIETQIF